MSLTPGAIYSILLSGSNTGPTALIQNRNLRVTVFPHWFKDATLSWSIPDDWGNCVFNIYTSRSETGPFEKITTQPISALLFKDSESRMFSKNAKDYYVVEAILLDQGGACLKSAPTTWEVKANAWVELRSAEIQRRFWLLLTKFVGPETYVFKRRFFGKRCVTCWDPVSSKVTNDRCPECFGTGWSGGYFEPYKTRFQFEATPNSVDLSYPGRTEPSQVGASTISFPDLCDWDLVYRVDDSKMYRVDNIGSTELLGRPVTQRMSLIELPKNYIEYDLVSKVIG